MPEPCGHVMCQACHHDNKPTAQQMSQAQNDFDSWASLGSAGLGRVERLHHLNSKPRRIDLDQAIAETIDILIGSINPVRRELAKTWNHKPPASNHGYPHSKPQSENEVPQITWVEFNATPARLHDIEITHTRSQQNSTSKEDQ